MPAYNYERAIFFLKMLLADIWKMTDNQQILACLNCMLLLAFSLKQATWRSDLGMSSMALTFFYLVKSSWAGQRIYITYYLCTCICICSFQWYSLQVIY